MFIYCIAEIVSCRNFFFLEFPCLVVTLGGDIRSCRADQLNFGIFCVDCLFECLISTKRSIFSVCHCSLPMPTIVNEGLWMSHFCTDTAPGTVHRAVCKLDQVNRILQKLLKLRLVHFHQLIGLELTRQADIQNSAAALHRSAHTAENIHKNRCRGSGCNGNTACAIRFPRSSDALPSD